MQQRRLGHLQLDTQTVVHLASGWKTVMTAVGFQVSIPLAAIFIGSLGHLAPKVNCIAESFMLELKKVTLFHATMKVEVLVSLHYEQLRCC